MTRVPSCVARDGIVPVALRSDWVICAKGPRVVRAQSRVRVYVYTRCIVGPPSQRGDQDEKHPEEVEPARHRARPAALGMSHHGQRGVRSSVGHAKLGKRKQVHSAVRLFILGLDPQIDVEVDGLGG